MLQIPPKIFVLFNEYTVIFGYTTGIPPNASVCIHRCTVVLLNSFFQIFYYVPELQSSESHRLSSINAFQNEKPKLSSTRRSKTGHITPT